MLKVDISKNRCMWRNFVGSLPDRSIVSTLNDRVDMINDALLAYDAEWDCPYNKRYRTDDMLTISGCRAASNMVKFNSSKGLMYFILKWQ